MYWHSMAAILKEKSICHICADIQNSNPKEPLISFEFPDRPWSKIASDIFVYQQNLYLHIDYYSNWPMIKNLSSLQTINCLKNVFSKNGIPDELVSDNGPPYAIKEFIEILLIAFIHSASSPFYPRSSEQAERMVQTAKLILKKKNT